VKDLDLFLNSCTSSWTIVTTQSRTFKIAKPIRFLPIIGHIGAYLFFLFLYIVFKAFWKIFSWMLACILYKFHNQQPLIFQNIYLKKIIIGCISDFTISKKIWGKKKKSSLHHVIIAFFVYFKKKKSLHPIIIVFFLFIKKKEPVHHYCSTPRVFMLYLTHHHTLSLSFSFLDPYPLCLSHSSLSLSLS